LETTYLISFIDNKGILAIDSFEAQNPVDACYMCQRRYKVELMDICSVIAGYDVENRQKRKVTIKIS